MPRMFYWRAAATMRVVATSMHRRVNMTQLELEKSHEERFRTALERLETAAATPAVPGEMPMWLDEVEQAYEELQQTLDRQVRSSHTSQLTSIRQEDPEMFRHVEQLQKEDAEIVAAVQSAVARLPILKPMVERVEPDEKRVERALAEFGEQAMQLVLRIRKQELALRTWLQEAFTRDRGPVD